MQAAIHVLRQLDVGDSIDIELVSRTLDTHDFSRGTTVLRGPEASAMAGVVLRREPLDLKLGALDVGPFRADLRARMFDFGVIALRFTFPITDLSAVAVIDLGNRLMLESAAFDRAARALWHDLAQRIRGAVVPWEGDTTTPLMEDFTVFTLPRIPAGDIEPQHVLAHMLLGEPRQRKLAASTVHELGRRTIHYYQDDLVLVDYDAAIIVDEDDAPDLVDIFEIASAQLLELRYYDAMLGRSFEQLLEDVRRARITVWLIRSPFRELARRAAILALELGQMTDRLERAITLVGDTYSSQIYRETALRFRLAEARAAVREKVTIIERMSEVLGHEIHARRDVVLELLVIILIGIEVVVAFRP